MTNRLQSYRVYHRFVRMMLFCGGCLQTSSIPRNFTYYSAVFVTFICCIQISLGLNYVFSNRRDLTVAVAISSIGRTAGAVAACMKVSSYLFHRDRVIDLHQTLHDLFEEELDRNEKIRAVMLSSLNEFSMPAFLFPLSVVLTHLMFLAPSLYRMTSRLVHLQVPHNYGMIFMVKYPWNMPDNFLYHLHYLYENCYGWIITTIFTTNGADDAFGFYAYQISSVLRAMSFRLANPLPEENFTHVLKTCTEKHKQLLRCREYLERLYGPIIIWMVLTNAVIMCSLMYQAVR